LHLGLQGSGYFHSNRLVTSPSVRVERPVVSAGTGDLLSTCMMLLHHHNDLAIKHKLAFANLVVAEYLSGKRVFLEELS
jgi:hypothetical protein